MATLTNRLHVMIDDVQLAVLEDEAKRSGATVSTLIRRAIDETYVEDAAARRARVARRLASESFLGAVPLPVEDWEVEKARLRDERVDVDS